MSMKPNLLSMTAEELKEAVAALGQPAYRADQIRKWLLSGTPFEEMNNLPKSLRETLKETYSDGSLTVEKRLKSEDGTVKLGLRCQDGQIIESVIMRYRHGTSVCVSTQAGCRMGCRFCASTLGGLVRSLEAGEILGQVVAAGKESGERIDGVVLMGIGEPLDNYANVIKFLRLVSSPDGLNIGMRHISLSTCGLVPGILKLAEEGLPVTLSISLHAPNDTIRSSLMPVNSRWSVAELLTACKTYFDRTGRRISFEYTVIRDVNDSAANAKQLIETLRKYLPDTPLHVNLIPVNNVRERGFTSDAESVKRFQGILLRAGINATVRRTLGDDIDAACGTLRRGN